MKKILLATTLLAATTGFAAAEVTLSGDARMGIISDFDKVDGSGAPAAPVGVNENDLQFTSRARVKFTLSGSTDGGLEFGASFRADNAAGAASGTAGSVFISGAFGKLSMGDVDDAANSAVGQVSGVGLTGLDDLNEMSYIGGGNDPTALYEYSTGDLTIYASVTNPTFESTAPVTASVVAYSAAAKYALGDYTVALGYENNDAGTDHVIVGATATFGAATVKAIYGSASGTVDGDQYAVSVDYKADALTVTAFYSNKDLPTLSVQEAYGLGASYDLGGGASVVGGYSHNETTNDDSYDLGVSMSF